MMLGEDRNYWINTYRTGYTSQTFQRIKGVVSPKQLKPFKSLVMLVDQSKLLVLTSKAIYRYALPSVSLEDSLLLYSGANFSGFAVSDDGKRAVFASENGNLYEFNPLDFDVSALSLGLHLATVPSTGNSDQILGVLLGNMSQSGLVTMVIRKYGLRQQVVFDIKTNGVVWYGPKFVYLNEVYPPVISNDDVWLTNDYPSATQGDVYKWNGAVFDLVGKVAPGSKSFRLNNNELISGTRKESAYTISPGVVAIYDLATLPADESTTLPVLRSINFPAVQNDYYYWSTGYDPHTDLFYARFMKNAISTLRLYDAGSMALVKEVFAYTYTPYSHEFGNNYHHSSRGYIETVK